MTKRHIGRIDGERDNQHKAMFEYFQRHRGRKISNIELAKALEIPCVSTYVSAINAQLPPDEQIRTIRARRENGRMGYWYLMPVASGEQTELLAAGEVSGAPRAPWKPL